MSVFTYADDGARIPFCPLAAGAHFTGCLLCSRRVQTVGIFIPQSPEMLSVVLRLRRHGTRTQSTPALVYGLCAACSEQADVFERVERVIEAAAERVVVQ